MHHPETRHPETHHSEATLFLNYDWTRLSSSPTDSKEYEELCSSAQKAIPLSPRHPRLISLLMGWVSPLLMLLYISLSLATATLQVSQWRVRFSAVSSTPCFFQTSGLSLAISTASNLCSAVAGLSLVVGVGALVHSHLGRGYFSFVLWWGQRNYGLFLWGLLNGVSTIIVEKDALGAGIVNILIVAGLDFLILQADARRLRPFRVFFALNAASLALSYLHSLASRNQCAAAAAREVGVSATTIISALRDIATVGYLFAVLKVLVRKALSPFPPALRYGVASHVQVSGSCTAGVNTVLILEDKSVTLLPADLPAGEALQVGGRKVFFAFPSVAFHRNLARWTLLPMVWIMLYLAGVFLDASLLRVHISERCWTKRPSPWYAMYVVGATASFASVAVVSLVALIVWHKLGSLTLKWGQYWCRQNWTLILLCFVRGCDNFRPGRPWLLGVSTLVNVAILLPIAFSTLDLVALLKPPLMFLRMFRIILVAQIFFQFYAYASGQAITNLCGEVESSSKVLFFIGKIQTTVLLIFSLQLIGMIYAKLFEGMTIPALTLSNKDRFSTGVELPKHRLSRLESSRGEVLSL